MMESFTEATAKHTTMCLGLSTTHGTLAECAPSPAVACRPPLLCGNVHQITDIVRQPGPELAELVEGVPELVEGVPELVEGAVG